MKHNTVYLMAAFLASFVSCAERIAPSAAGEDSSPQEATAPLISLNVSASFDAGTKAEFIDATGGKVSLRFEVGDSIYVSNQPTPVAESGTGRRACFKVTEVGGDGVARFEPVSAAELSALCPDSTVFYATFGGNGSAIKSGTLVADNTVQSIVATSTFLHENSIRTDQFVSAARAKKDANGNISFKFIPIIGLAKITIPSTQKDTIRKILIRGNGSSSNAAQSYLSCYYRVKFNDDNSFNSYTRAGYAKSGSSYVLKVGGNKHLAVYYGNQGEKGVFVPGTYYIPMIPDNEAHTVGISLYNTTETTDAGKIYTITRSFNVQRGHIVDLGTINMFTNAVIRTDWADPTVWDGGDGWFYSVATGLGTIRKSRNLYEWTDMGISPLTSAARDSVKALGDNVWAPDVVKIKDKWMLYAACVRSGTDTRIVAFSSTSPTGPFSMENIVTDGLVTGLSHNIDPEVVVDQSTGKVWLFFGSSKIYRVQLTEDGCRVAQGAEYVSIGGMDISEDTSTRQKVFEGAYLYYRDGWWYLLASVGCYWNYTYKMIMGRSKTIEGSFVDKDGNSLEDCKYSILMSSASGDRFYGPGHNGEIFTDNTGHDYIVYHCHDTKAPSKSVRYTLLQRIFWDSEGWPYVDSGKPNPGEIKPVFQ